MLIIINKHLIGSQFVGISLWPFIFIKDSTLKKDTYFINHEKIHLKQQSELLVLPFYILYLLEFCIRAFKYRNFNRAYHNISFEQEAYANEENSNYLVNRKPFSFLKYI